MRAEFASWLKAVWRASGRGLIGGAFDLASAHANLIWSPVANSDLGVEYIHADRKTEDGLKGSLNRLQASAKYAF